MRADQTGACAGDTSEGEERYNQDCRPNVLVFPHGECPHNGKTAADVGSDALARDGEGSSQYTTAGTLSDSIRMGEKCPGGRGWGELDHENEQEYE
jgi:hypothetical protein